VTIGKADKFVRYLHPHYCPDNGWTCKQTRDLIEEILTTDLNDGHDFDRLHEKAKNHVYARALLFVRAVDAQVDESIQRVLQKWLT
jgi:hypothetical protein